MEIITSPEKIRDIGIQSRVDGKMLALVPTMGFFHQGHLNLMRWAGENADQTVVSLFVNPAQFGPGEDLDKYPRDLEKDIAQAETLGVDYFFLPRARDMYPEGFDTWVEVPQLSSRLCGRSRPGHFRGVTTVVCKLLNLVMPGIAVFGLKDRQQFMVIAKMVRELDMPVKIIGRPTVREEDGLAMSSRNSYLTPDQRKKAANIYKGLLMIRDQVSAGRTNPKELEDLLEKYYLERIPGCRIDYVRIKDLKTLETPDQAGRGAFAAVAVKLGRARLIDNLEL